MIKDIKEKVEKNIDATDLSELQKELRSFEKRIISILIGFIVILGVGFFAIASGDGGKGFLVNGKNSRFSTSLRDAFSGKEETISKFRTAFNTVIEDKSSQEDVKFVVDENYFDEKVLKTYVSIVCAVKESKIQYKHIESCIDKVFLKRKTKDGVTLILKDEETLIMECEKSWQLCALDYAFMGTSHERLTEKSKGFYVSQNDAALEKVSYGTSNVKYSGCGPAALTMALNYTKGSKIVTLEEVVKWADENDMYEENEGTKWELMNAYPSQKGLYVEEVIASDYDEFVDLLEDGKVMITSMSQGHFTDGGHFIVITSARDGMVSVLDSSSICRSLKDWDSYTVFDESNKYFWVISTTPPPEPTEDIQEE